MLDQNTDRMWYVIGAVIIGAAIILIMNNTFPQLFASVGNTFKDKTEDVGKVVDDLTMTDGVGPVVRTSENLFLTSPPLEEATKWFSFNGQFEYQNQSLKSHTTYVFTADVKTVTGNPIDKLTVAPIEWYSRGLGYTQLFGDVPIIDGKVTYTFTTNSATYGFIVYPGVYQQSAFDATKVVQLANYRLVEVLD